MFFLAKMDIQDPNLRVLVKILLFYICFEFVTFYKRHKIYNLPMNF